MKTKIVLSMILVIALSFVCLSLAVEKVQVKPVKPGVDQLKPKGDQQVPSGAIQGLPDLVVDSIWLNDKCQINFKLRNFGPGSIPDGEHLISIVGVWFGSKYMAFKLSTIDYQGVLKKPGGFVSFNTKIELKSSMYVYVIVDRDHDINEVNHNNNETVATLRCPVAQLSKDIGKVRSLQKPDASAQKSTLSKTLCLQITFVSTSPLPPTTIGWDYTYQLEIKGVNTPVTFTARYKEPSGANVFINGMPPGLNLSSSGLINGQPEKAGYFLIAVRVQDQCPSRPQGIEKVFYLNVKPQ